MNIYKQNFTEEFKKSLPIKWERWANVDLTTIPKKYHKCFTTDWNWGNYSSMRWNERDHIQELWLEYNSWVIAESVKDYIADEPQIEMIDFDDDEDNQGFIKF